METWKYGVNISINSTPTRFRKNPSTTPETHQTLKENLTTTVQKKRKTSMKLMRKHFHAIVPAGVFLLIASILIISNYFTSEDMMKDSFSARIFSLETNISVDEVTSANVAKIIANDAEMIVAGNVNNLVSNVEAKVNLNISEQSYVAKPQIVATDAKTSGDIKEYVTKEGDTISSIAGKFGVTSDTIRWANNITGNLVATGKKLTILPITGILYEVKSGDTAAKLADKYESDTEEIISFNDAEVSGLTVGEQIIIPGGQKPAPVVNFATINTFTSLTPTYGGNTYFWGNCTWYVFNRRAQIGRPIPNNLGDAYRWFGSAIAQNLPVDRKPELGAIYLEPEGSYIGHVAVVERLNPDGSMLVSEMNYNWQTGVRTERLISAADVNSHYYLH